VSDVIVAPNVRDLNDLAKTLAGWLADQMPQASGIVISDLAYPRGAGQSHETILFNAQWREGAREIAQGLVVRIKPTRFTVFLDDLFEEQYRVMKALHQGGQVRVAKPLWLERDPGLLGAPFFVMEKAEGRVPVSIPPYSEAGWVHESTPAQRRKLWQGGVAQLAAVQHVPLDSVAFLSGPDHAPRGLEQEWDKWTRTLAWVRKMQHGQVLEAAHARLLSLWPDNRPEGMVWGDARIGNMIFDRNYEVTAVVDWEQPSLGGALNDLAWFLVSAKLWHGATDKRPFLEGMGSHDETIVRWESLTGKSARDLDWYIDFTHFKMACNGARMGYLRGVTMMDEKTLAKRLKVA
jgi:aminoglycoside phosphotransferase (APT) family kinase protein